MKNKKKEIIIMADKAPAIYGTQKPGLPKRLGERLRELWEPQDYVRIMNIDDETFYWQVLAPQDETYDIDRGPTKVTYRRSPRQYSIKPGESIPLEGWNAYICVESLYKKVLAKNTGLKGQQKVDATGKPQEKVINWEDPNGWDIYLPRIYMGKETPTFGGQEAGKSIADVETEAPAVISAEQAFDNNRETKQTVSDLAKELGLDIST